MTEYDADGSREREDRLATEEPLEIRVLAPGGPARRLGITMRTPGNDFELAAGWLVNEGLATREAISSVRYCTDAELSPEEEFNVVTVALTEPLRADPIARQITSACGVCGADSIREVTSAAPVPGSYSAAALAQLPDRMRAHQSIFERTGALHAAALFSAAGEHVVLREDVGRHNAVDKVIGSRILANEAMPPILVVSGRIAFEIVQKALVSGVDAIVAVGAPTSLSVELAAANDLVLAGFVRDGRCVVYAGADRVGV